MNEQIKKKNPWKVAFLILVPFLIGIIILLLILLHDCRKESEQQLAKLTNQISELKREKDSLKSNNEELMKTLELKIEELASTRSLLITYLEESNKDDKEIRGLENEVSEIKKEVSKLNSKLDSVLNRMVVSLDTTSKVSETPCDSAKTDSVPAGSLSVKVVKTSLDKKGNPTKKQNLYNYSSVLFHSSEKGFLTDNFGPVSLGNYYIQGSEDEIELFLSSLIKENLGAFHLVKLNKATREKTSLVPENKLFPMGVGGLSDKDVWSSHWKGDQFLEKQVDEALKKKGNIKFWAGIGGLTGSVGSYIYWVNQPDETRNYVNGKLISTEGKDRQTLNSWGEGLSIAAGLISTYFIIDGFLDKRASVKINPCEIELLYEINLEDLFLLLQNK